MSARLYFRRMTVLKAHFDGKGLVPDEPVDLPVNCALEVQVKPLTRASSPELAPEDKPLLDLLELARKLPVGPGAATDGAAQHDHYMYGLPKRP